MRSNESRVDGWERILDRIRRQYNQFWKSCKTDSREMMRLVPWSKRRSKKQAWVNLARVGKFIYQIEANHENIDWIQHQQQTLVLTVQIRSGLSIWATLRISRWVQIARQILHPKMRVGMTKTPRMTFDRRRSCLKADVHCLLQNVRTRMVASTLSVQCENLGLGSSRGSLMTTIVISLSLDSLFRRWASTLQAK